MKKIASLPIALCLLMIGCGQSEADKRAEMEDKAKASQSAYDKSRQEAYEADKKKYGSKTPSK